MLLGKGGFSEVHKVRYKSRKCGPLDDIYNISKVKIITTYFTVMNLTFHRDSIQKNSDM